MSAQFACERAAFKIVPRGASAGEFDELTAGTHLPNGQGTALVGYLSCPRGCGTVIYWSLAPEMAGYKEQFLLFLHQQLSWTACPEHTHIQPQCLLYEHDASSFPTSSAIMAAGRRYRNLYE